MRALTLAVEAAPWAKVGGLSEVAGSLPRALAARHEDLDVHLMVPMHAGAADRAGALERVARAEVPHAGGSLYAEAYRTRVDGVTVDLVTGPPIPSEAPVYDGNPDREGHRFTFFCLAALELCRALKIRPDVVHCHDWHTSPALWALRTRYWDDPFFRETAGVLTLHNVPYTGVGAGGALEAFGLGPSRDPRLPEGLRHAPLALGILTADELTAVSPTYAEEILGPLGGRGLEGLLRSRRDRLTGVLNGLDVASWDPSGDWALEERFDLSRYEERARNKRALLEEVGLPVEMGRPLLGVVSRLVEQKGIDLALAVVEHLLKEGGEEGDFALLVLGTGDPALERALASLADRFRGRVRALIGYDARLSRRIFAASDLLLLPSRYEPCGIAQMMGMRYGAVPLARETGGLADTVRDPSLSADPNGFLFPEPTPRSLAFGLRRALYTYRERPEAFRALSERGMREDFSWDAAADRYREIYRSAVARRRRKA